MASIKYLFEIIVMLLISISAAKAQSLPVVSVYGSYAWGGGFGAGFSFGQQVGAAPFPEYPMMVAAIDQHLALINVRCSGGNYKDVTSHSDELSRTLAAEQIFRVVKQGQTLWDWVFKKKPYYGGRLLVIFADGGQEEFLVTNPMLSSAIPLGPIPNTRKMGDGAIKRHHICG
ncbi:hypothetical protein [Xylophilus sp. GOD-11R]|uniref:hypothetical protein n=1 Tax=Xylophilus sp. GOD-11R TaxID=3089814 RepID=UPI00298CB2FF|nr:hypothetical protein [Xylophilus sp. GOD-11R]WPB56897.1 hypothetical protein R9X41_22640 [Xylophilus sp. GOD-11R]